MHVCCCWHCEEEYHHNDQEDEVGAVNEDRRFCRYPCTRRATVSSQGQEEEHPSQGRRHREEHTRRPEERGVQGRWGPVAAERVRPLREAETLLDVAPRPDAAEDDRVHRGRKAWPSAESGSTWGKMPGGPDARRSQSEFHLERAVGEHV